MNPNVRAVFAVCERLKSYGITHCVISPGSRSTPLAYVAHQLFDTTVVIDERDAGFVALGIAESTGRAAVVITTSGSAPTHLYPSVVEAFHSNIPMIVLTADRPHEVRGRGAPQTIDQVDLFGTAVRYSADAPCPDEESIDVWMNYADELFSHAHGENIGGPVHLNIGFREPLTPDGDEDVREISPLASLGRDDSVGSVIASSSAVIPSVVEGSFPHNKIVHTIGRGATLTRDDVRMLRDHGSVVIADVISNVRDGVLSYYDFVIRSHKELVPSCVVQWGDPLTSKAWNQSIEGSEVIHIGRYDDGRDPYGAYTHNYVVSQMSELVYAFIEQTSPSREFTDGWEKAHASVENKLDELLQRHPDSEPAFFAQLGDTLARNEREMNILVASSMSIRYAEWLWAAPSTSSTVFSHRGTNGIDGMLASAYGIGNGSTLPTLCVLGDVAFAHDLGFLPHLSHLTQNKQLCIVCVVDNRGGAIFRHLDQAQSEPLAPVYNDLFRTEPGINIEKISGASGAHYETGTFDQCCRFIDDLLSGNGTGAYVVHVKVEHESGLTFMSALTSH